MAAGMAIVGGIKAAGAIKGYRDEKDALSKQNEIDQANIERMKREGEETIKRTQHQMAQKEGTAKTVAGGSGFATGSSQSSYLNTMAEIHKSDLDWLQSSVDSGIDIAGAEASARYDIGRNNARSNLISGIASSAGSFFGAKGRHDYTGGDWWT